MLFMALSAMAAFPAEPSRTHETDVVWLDGRMVRLVRFLDPHKDLEEITHTYIAQSVEVEWNDQEKTYTAKVLDDSGREITIYSRVLRQSWYW